MGVPILGICLGAQLLAQCSGGKVVPGQKGIELGYQKWKFSNDQLLTQRMKAFPKEIAEIKKEIEAEKKQKENVEITEMQKEKSIDVEEEVRNKKNKALDRIYGDLDPFVRV